MPAGLGGFLLFWNLNLGGGTPPTPPGPRLFDTTLIETESVLTLVEDVSELTIISDMTDGT